ncbi:MAG: DUF4038 domain-containing protein [Planctomycetes bacterium]|nr:DUF4038 domain-containing protein [Planctomycetota bacterium]
MSTLDQPIARHTVVHLDFTSAADYDNPLQEIELEVVFQSPSGRELRIDGYWDGGSRFRAAFSPDEAGSWRWRTGCTPADPGLDGREGAFECVLYTGDNPLYRQGPLRVSDDGTHLVGGDGRPFFWLADTAWNGVIRGDDDNWAEYLAIRRRQGFNAIQFVAGSWRGDAVDAYGTPSVSTDAPARVFPEYFQRIDRRVAMINEAGLVAAPVVLWTLLESDIGQRLSEGDAVRYARYVVARYGACQAVWLLGGDGNYARIGYERWKRIGRAVFDGRARRLVTLHPCGCSWPNEEMRNESWFDFAGYQSGHGDGDHDRRWHTQGPPATEWANTPPKPVINLEPNYELAHGYGGIQEHTAANVRRAAWWSLLVSPTAGLTYGHDAIWNWNSRIGPSEGHGQWHDGAVPSYRIGLETEGLEHIGILKAFFDALPWWKLRPAQDRLVDQPGLDDAAAHIAAARTTDGSHLLAYTPRGLPVRLRDAGDRPARWFDPRAGTWRNAQCTDGVYPAPNGKDWLLVLT